MPGAWIERKIRLGGNTLTYHIFVCKEPNGKICFFTVLAEEQKDGFYTLHFHNHMTGRNSVQRDLWWSDVKDRLKNIALSRGIID